MLPSTSTSLTPHTGPRSGSPTPGRRSFHPSRYPWTSLAPCINHAHTRTHVHTHTHAFRHSSATSSHIDSHLKHSQIRYTDTRTHTHAHELHLSPYLNKWENPDSPSLWPSIGVLSAGSCFPPSSQCSLPFAPSLCLLLLQDVRTQARSLCFPPTEHKTSHSIKKRKLKAWWCPRGRGWDELGHVKPARAAQRDLISKINK